MKTRVELSQEEVGQALVYFALHKANLKGAVRHSIQINGIWSTLGDGPAVIVELEPVTMAPGGEG